MNDGTSFRMARKAAVSGVALTAVTLLPIFDTTAFAADQGNWNGSCNPSQERACMRYFDLFGNSSSTVDSDFANDSYPFSGGMNDRVSHIQNQFSNMEVRGFRNKDYTNTGWDVGTSCVASKTVRGTYVADGNDRGLSSFKFCV